MFVITLYGFLLPTACSSSSEDESSRTALEVVFTPSAGTFVGSEAISLSARDSRAEIHYTTDGSLPSAASPRYSGPITLQQTTRLRALAVVPAGSAGRGTAGNGGSSAATQGPIAGQTYLRVTSEYASFTSNLPILVIRTNQSTPLDPSGDDFVPATLDVFEPSGSGTRLVARAALDTRLGIHVRGETSRLFSKKQYALELWSELEDQDVDRPLLGMPADADWVLNDPIQFDRTLIRNALAFELSNRIGRYAPRTRFAEVFLVAGNADVGASTFFGFFTLIEKIKRGADRVAVKKLSEDDLSEPNVSGGYVLRIDKGANDFQAAGRQFQFVYPDADAMKVAARKPQVDFIRNFVDGFGRAVTANDFKNPSTGQSYSELIDVDAFIDHNLLGAFTKNADALRISAYFYKDRSARLCAGPIWDFDRSLGTPYDDRAASPEEWRLASSDGTDYFNEGFWHDLFRDPIFKSRYRARFLAVLDDQFAEQRLTALVDSLVGQVGAAANRDFARWTDTPPRNGSYEAEVALLKDFLVRRRTWIRGQLQSW